MNNELRVRFYQGYAGKPKCSVYIGEKEYVIEIDELEQELEKQIAEKGYTIEQSKRQKYPRLVINY